jgi:glycerol dehydrogenase
VAAASFEDDASRAGCAITGHDDEEAVMHEKAVFPAQYIQGPGATEELPALLGRMGERALILASPTARERALVACGVDWTSLGARLETFRGECCEEELERVAGAVSRARADVLVGVGGGKTIDTAKIVADRARLPVVVVPTIASTDAPTSGCAVIYSSDGVFQSVCYQRANPAAVLVDVAIVAAAPVRFLVAGMGDALSTWFEARSCERTRSPNECGGRGTATGLAIARLCYETLLSHGTAARRAAERHLVTPALERIVEANTLMSGLGFESAGLATAHAVHNGLTVLPDTHSSYHGEKVAFGVLTGLHLTGAPAAEVSEVYSFCEDVGLPTTLSDVGLSRADRRLLAPAAEKACEAGSPIHHEAGVVTPGRVLDAMLAADALGQEKRGGRPTAS